MLSLRKPASSNLIAHPMYYRPIKDSRRVSILYRDDSEHSMILNLCLKIKNRPQMTTLGNV